MTPRRISGRVVGRGLLAVCVPLAVAAAPLGAQTPDTVLSLPGALDLLAARSPTYRAALAQADAAAEGVWQSWGAFLPSLTAGAQFSRNEFTTRTFLDPVGVSQTLDDPVTSTSKSASQSLSLQWSVFRGGRRFFDLSASRARARAADLAAEATRVDLESRVETRYYEALKQGALAQLARRLVDARQRDLDVARARFRIAAVAQTDVLQAQIAVNQQELAAAQAEQGAEAARRELSALLGLDEDLAYELRDTAAVFDPSGLEPDSLVALALTGHPDLASLDAEVDADRRSLWAARGTWLPNVSLGMSWSRSEALGPNGTFFTLSPQNTGTNFFLTFSFPLLNGLEKKWQTGQRAAELEAARARRRDRALGLGKDVRNAYDRLVTAYRTVKLQRQNVDLAREAVRLATERYRVGAASYVELQNATVQATEAERGLIEARYDFMEAFAALKAAVGRSLGPTGGGRR